MLALKLCQQPDPFSPLRIFMFPYSQLLIGMVAHVSSSIFLKPLMVIASVLYDTSCLCWSGKALAKALCPSDDRCFYIGTFAVVPVS